MAEKPLTDWSSGLCDCFEDLSSCKIKLVFFILKVVYKPQHLCLRVFQAAMVFGAALVLPAVFQAGLERTTVSPCVTSSALRWQ